MNTAKQTDTDYGVILKGIRDRMETVEIIMGQLTNGSYASADCYANNMDIVADFYQDISGYLQNPSFMIYLKQNDTNLFINILSIGRAIALMKNFLLNASQIFKRASSP